MTRTLRVGTRGSALALAQTRMVADRLAAAAGGIPVEIIPITTHGDTSRASLASLGGVGVFAAALRDGLREGRCDVAVHSFKDLPTAAVPGLRIGAVPARADARDVLVSTAGAGPDTLPRGARVGTGSPRRIAQLRRVRPDLDVVDIRGNVDSRLARLHEDGDRHLDAVVLAAAGMQRLGRTDAGAVPLPLADWPTAPAQGALAVEVRDVDAASGPLADAMRAIDDTDSHVAADAERAVLAGLQAGCAAPLGTTATVSADAVTVTATVYSLDGRRTATAAHTAPRAGRTAADAAADAAAHVVAALLAQGAADLAPLGGSKA